MLNRSCIVAVFAAGLASASPCRADDTAAINLAGVQFKNATSQNRTSAPDTIDPAFGYNYVISGSAKGDSGLLKILFPNPTPLATILETLSPGSSSLLTGAACNAAGTHPFSADPQNVSGSTVLLGVTVTFAATVTVGIDASNIAFFSLTNVQLAPASLVGSLTITSGQAVLNGECTSDFDGSGFVDFDDFNAYVDAFTAGLATADMDCSGFVDFDDFNAFVQRFEAGC